MRPVTFLSFFVCFAFGPAARGEPTEEVRAIIMRAIEAQGGEERLARATAVHFKVKGLITDPINGKFTQECFKQKSNKIKDIFKLDLQDNADQAIEIIRVYDGKKVWMVMNGQVQDAPLESDQQFKEYLHVERITELLPLLKEKEFGLSALGESKVQDRTAVGIKITTKGKPDVKMYFDKANSLLAKVEFLSSNNGEGKREQVVTVYSDYREYDPIAGEERILKEAKVPIEGPALLAWLRRQTKTDKDLEQAEKLIRQLGDNSFAVREKASAALVTLGPSVVPMLRRALKDPDLEIARRAEVSIEQIEKASTADIVSSVIRLIGHRKPKGAAEVLLAYVPFAADASLAGEVRAALTNVALRDGKPDPILVQAVNDKNPLRQAAASEALGQTKPSQTSRRLLLEGFKHPMKVTYFRDGKKQLEYEYTEINYYTHFDDKMFAKPTEGKKE